MNNSVKYSVRVKNGSGWRRFENIRLMISVGQPYHEGGKLEAVVEWINRNVHIKNVHVSVNDFLQRHNYYAQGFARERADAIALSEGALWISRNQDALSQIQAPTIITRWRDCFGTRAYACAKAQIETLRQTDSGFASAVEADASALARRKLLRGEHVPAGLTDFSREYLCEELAVFACQANELPATDVYPGSQLEAAEYLRGRQLHPDIAALSDRYFTRIDFARLADTHALLVA